MIRSYCMNWRTASVSVCCSRQRWKLQYISSKVSDSAFLFDPHLLCTPYPVLFLHPVFSHLRTVSRMFPFFKQNVPITFDLYVFALRIPWLFATYYSSFPQYSPHVSRLRTRQPHFHLNLLAISFSSPAFFSFSTVFWSLATHLTYIIPIFIYHGSRSTSHKFCFFLGPPTIDHRHTAAGFTSAEVGDFVWFELLQLQIPIILTVTITNYKNFQVFYVNALNFLCSSIDFRSFENCTLISLLDAWSFIFDEANWYCLEMFHNRSSLSGSFHDLLMFFGTNIWKGLCQAILST